MVEHRADDRRSRAQGRSEEVVEHQATETAEEFTRMVTETSRETYQAIINNMMAVQEQNVRLALSMFESSMDLLRGQAQSSNGAMQSVAEQSEKQREAWGRLAHQVVDFYLDMWLAPLSCWEMAWRAGEKSRQ